VDFATGSGWHLPFSPNYDLSLKTCRWEFDRGLVGRAGEIAEVDLGDFVFGVEFFFDGGEGAEEEVAGVSHDGGAARVDAIFGFEMEEAGEEVVDGDGGFEFSETGGESGGEVSLLDTDDVGDSVFGADTGGGAGGSVTAASAGGSAVLATGQVIRGNGVDELFGHSDPRFLDF
jgi:hypothetical protein